MDDFQRGGYTIAISWRGDMRRDIEGEKRLESLFYLIPAQKG